MMILHCTCSNDYEKNVVFSFQFKKKDEKRAFNVPWKSNDYTKIKEKKNERTNKES